MKMRVLDRLALTACCGIASVSVNLAQPASAAFDALYTGPKLYCVPCVR